VSPRLLWTRLPRLVTWVVLTVVVLGPLYWVTMSSFKSREEILRTTPTLIPTDPTLDNFRQLFLATDYPTYLTNSFVVGILTTLCTVVVSVLAAFGLYRVRIPGGNKLALLILVAYMIPGTLLLVPLYQSLATVYLIDTRNALVLVNVAFTAPFCTWLLRGFLLAIPRDLDEAAAVDGAGPLRSLLRIVLPLLAPGIAAIAIYAFVFSWTEYVFASQLVISDSLKTLPIGLSDIMGQYTVNWGLLMAGTVCTILPAVIPFLIAGRHFVGGLTTGAVR
jgi:multiple sugar transport system permease protein